MSSAMPIILSAAALVGALSVLALAQDHHGGEDSPAGRYSAKAEAKALNLTAEIRLKLEVKRKVSILYKKRETTFLCF